MNFSEIKELLALFEEGSIREFDLTKEDFQLYLSKNEAQYRNTERGQKLHEPQVGETGQSQTESGSQAVATKSDEPSTQEVGAYVNSPIVGVIYLCSAPGEAAFKEVGDTVQVGEVLCIVEAMKVMNEIMSDVSGVIAEVLVENEDVVEYGQPLFRII